MTLDEAIKVLQQKKIEREIAKLDGEVESQKSFYQAYFVPATGVITIIIAVIGCYLTFRTDRYAAKKEVEEIEAAKAALEIEKDMFNKARLASDSVTKEANEN